MNCKNVMIEMKSIQSVYDEKTETSLVTEGKLCSKGKNSYVISYEDSEATGFTGSVTEISVMDNLVASIIRRGTANSDLMIEPGKKHHCHYETPYGEMDVGIYTHVLENKLKPDGGQVYMKYTVDVNSSYMSDNEIIMTVKNA